METVPGKLSGAPVIVHSRVRPDELIVNRAEGLAWLAASYSLLDTVKQVLTFYDRENRRLAHPA